MKREKREKGEKGEKKARFPHDIIGRNAQNYRYIGRNAQNLKKLVRTNSSTLSLLELLSELTTSNNHVNKMLACPLTEGSR